MNEQGRRLRRLVMLVCMVVLVGALAITAGCGANTTKAASSAKEPTETSCVKCHTDKEALKAGITTEGLKPEALFVSQEFLDSKHGKATCVSCHGGVGDADAIAAAHKGMKVDPTEDGGAATCGKSGCHNDTTGTFKKSLHYTANGILDKMKIRLSGQPGDNVTYASDVFSAPDSCSGCHATCGQCHVSNPTANGGGLLEGHMFVTAKKQKDNDRTCGYCHDAIGPQFIKSDLHHKFGMSCADCHTDKDEVHGGATPSKLVGDAVTVKCIDCHARLSGVYHTGSHATKVTCQACHSNKYYSCEGCHEGKPKTVTETVKLGLGGDGRITTFAHTPISPKMFGKPALDASKLGTKASWIQVVPHTVNKPVVSEQFCSRCHGAGTAFLKKSDLQFKKVETKLLYPGAPLRSVKP